MASRIYNRLDGYYQEAVDAIRSQINVCADAILPLDSKKDPIANLGMSFVRNILTRDGRYIHPVAAMYQLCALRVRIQEELSSMDTLDWPGVSSYEVERLPASLLECTTNLSVLGLGAKTAKSAYLKRGKARFADMRVDANAKDYMARKTDYVVDSEALKKDGDMIVTRLADEAQQILKRRVLGVVADRVNALIDAYRSFFRRFASTWARRLRAADATTNTSPPKIWRARQRAMTLRARACLAFPTELPAPSAQEVRTT